MFWSVMVPTYDPNAPHLGAMLGSVVSQDRGPGEMHIEVVDDCSPRVNVQELLAGRWGDRVRLSRTPVNQGLAGCWNTCIERAQGEWIHILHQDDYVLPGFYAEIETIARSHPEVGLIATRSFFVDEGGVITGVTPRIPSLEQGGRDVREFLYDNRLQFPGVVVRKQAYQACGGFRSDLSYTLDWEMWTRVIGQAGGAVSPQVLACYRRTGQNATSRLAKTAETLTDRERLNRLFAQRYPGFNPGTANRHVCEFALHQANLFRLSEDYEAARAYLKYWRRKAPFPAKARRYSGIIYRSLRNAFSKLRPRKRAVVET